MTDLPAEAVEAAARAFDAAEYDDPDSVTEAEWAAVSDAEREFYLSAARRALTAATPIIVAQATAELRDRIKARRFKVASIHHIHASTCLCGFHSDVARARTEHILDALLREGE